MGKDDDLRNGRDIRSVFDADTDLRNEILAAANNKNDSVPDNGSEESGFGILSDLVEEIGDNLINEEDLPSELKDLVNDLRLLNHSEFPPELNDEQQSVLNGAMKISNSAKLYCAIFYWQNAKGYRGIINDDESMSQHGTNLLIELAEDEEIRAKLCCWAYVQNSTTPSVESADD